MKEHEITALTLVWTEGMENWMVTEKIDDFCEIIYKSPPPFPVSIEKPFLMEAEIKKSKEKLISPETEVLVAK